MTDRNSTNDVAAMGQALAATAPRLHGIASRTAGEQIAAEVLGVSDALRAGAAGRIAPGSQPADFQSLLLAAADPVNGEGAA